MKFVFWCSNEQRQFRLAELDAIIHMLGLKASVAIHTPFGLPSFKIIFSGLFSFKINVFRLSSFKIKMFRMSSFKIKKNDCPPSRSKSFGLSSFKGGVVGEELITALGCTEPVDGRRGKSHPWKVSDHLTSIKHIISDHKLVSFRIWPYWSDPWFFRSVSVKFGLEVWAEGDSSELFHQKLKEVYYIISYVYFVFQSLNVFKTSFLHFSFHLGRTKISLGKTSSSKFKLKSSTRRWLPWHLLLWLLHLSQLANEEKISRIEMLMDSSGGALPFKGAVSLNRWASISDLFLSSEDHHHLIAVQTWPYIIWSSGVLTKTKNLNTLHKFSWVGRCILYTIYTTV